MNTDIYLKETKLLNYSASEIQNLITAKKWNTLNEYDKIKEIYNFIRDEILFGYNIDDNVTATKVLKDGFGQCNTKGTLFMALLRGVGIPCRVHAFTINKKLQKGVMNAVIYSLTPINIFHSWVEVFYNGKWYNLEGIILDKKYLLALQRKFSDCKESFIGYGVGVKNFKNPIIDWNGNNTYIQKKPLITTSGYIRHLMICLQNIIKK